VQKRGDELWNVNKTLLCKQSCRCITSNTPVAVITSFKTPHYATFASFILLCVKTVKELDRNQQAVFAYQVPGSNIKVTYSQVMNKHVNKQNRLHVTFREQTFLGPLFSSKLGSSGADWKEEKNFWSKVQLNHWNELHRSLKVIGTETWESVAMVQCDMPYIHCTSDL